MSFRKLPWALWRAQIVAVVRLELKKTLFARRGLWIYFLAFAPVLLYAAHSLSMIRTGRRGNFGEDTHIFAAVFQFFYLRLAIFFGCVGIFMNLFRGEVVDKSLHYYFLAPVRREVLLIGKYLSGLLAAAVIFCSSTLIQLVASYWYFSSNLIQDYLSHGNGLGHVVAYLGVTLLACIGYGSIFLAAGVIFRNPLVPALVVLLWETINGFLPPLLQKCSVIFYLKSLCPVSVPASVALEKGNPLALIAVNVNPVSAVTAIVGLLVLSIAALALSSLRLRRMEVEYSTE
jgi:ABC-type transport system involved in multi-copper enzyme maturation permease subunit